VVPDRGRGGGTPVLLLHGGPGFPSAYLAPLAALADERPVIFYDQLGCGHSDRPTDDSLWTVDRAVAEVDQVRKALGLEHVHLYGHSWGSMLAIAYALAHPQGLVSLTLASPIASVKRWEADADRLLEDMPADSRQTIRDVLDGKLSATDPRAEAAYVQYLDRHMFLRASSKDPIPQPMHDASATFNQRIYELMWGTLEQRVTGRLSSFETTDRLHELAMPTLFTCGRFDEATPAAAESYRALVPGASLTVFEHSAHMTMLEEPQRYLETLRQFMRSAETRAR